MDTFIARLRATSTLSPRRTLGDALTDVLRELPPLGTEFRTTTGTWHCSEDLVLEWAASLPVNTSCLVELSETANGRVLVFGEVFDGESGTTSSSATLVWRAHQRGGAEAVRLLDGCFAAIVCDLEQRVVYACGDIIGQRALRFVETRDGIFLSPHEACLVASGQVSLNFDRTSLASCLVIENSIAGRSLLTDVEVLEGNQILEVRPDAVSVRRRLPRLDFSGRISARDHAAQARYRDAAIERIVAVARPWACSGRALRCELTAGIDSRASFATLLGVGAGRYVEAVTSGGSESTDVRTAKRLALLGGVHHSQLKEPAPDTSSFEANATLRAFVTNGETDAKRAARTLPKWDPDGAVRVDGAASEIFRGFFYTYMGPTGIAPSDPGQLLGLLLKRRHRRFSALPFVDEAIRASLRERLAQCLADFFALSPNGNDVLDMYYLFERCARWGAAGRKATWGRVQNPLVIPSVVRQLYQMPSPIGHWAGIHTELIKRFFPAGMWPLINGTRPLIIEGPGSLKSGMRLTLTVLNTARDKLRHRLNKRTRNQYAARADLFADELHDFIRGLLTSEDAVTRETLGLAGTQRLLNEHRAKRNHLAVLGYAVTHDIYFTLLRRLYARARA